MVVVRKKGGFCVEVAMICGIVRLSLVSSEQDGRCGLWGLQTFPRGLDVLLPCPKVIAAPGVSAETQAGA